MRDGFDPGHVPLSWHILGQEIGHFLQPVCFRARAEQQVQEVPIAISAYSGEFLQDTGITGFEQLGNIVPGLQTQVQSPNNPGFVIRGVTSDSGSS